MTPPTTVVCDNSCTGDCGSTWLEVGRPALVCAASASLRGASTSRRTESCSRAANGSFSPACPAPERPLSPSSSCALTLLVRPLVLHSTTARILTRHTMCEQPTSLLFVLAMAQLGSLPPAQLMDRSDSLAFPTAQCQTHRWRHDTRVRRPLRRFNLQKSTNIS